MERSEPRRNTTPATRMEPRRRRAKRTAVDLFSGCGGLTVGLKRAGFGVTAAVERDPATAAVYAANHPEVQLWIEDIRELSPGRMMRVLGLHRGSLDLLAGCPPCQGFSTLRTLNGARTVSDPRNDLIEQFASYVDALLPRAVMFENVPALATDERMSRLRDRLRGLGYQFVDGVLDASRYAVPQRRKRLLLVAVRGAPVKFAPAARKLGTVRSTISTLPRAGESGDYAHDIVGKHGDRVRALIAAIPKDGGSRSALPLAQRLSCHANFRGFNDVYGRMAWDAVAPTITGGCWNPSKGRFLHPSEDRAITLREAALLQTFPRDYEFPKSAGKSAIGEMIGNALPPEFVARHARAIGRAIARAEETNQALAHG